MAIQFLNTVAVDTNVLYVDTSSDRVGVGTTSPNQKLDVNGNIQLAQYGYIYFGSNSSNQFRLSNSLSGSQITQTGSGNLELQSASNSIYFKSGGTTKAVITSAGNFGIGTTSPSDKLHIEDLSPALKILSNLLYGTSSINMGNGLTNEAASIACYNNPANSFLELIYDNGNTGDARIRVGQRNLDFMIDSATAMYINSSKNVGIGTTNPSKKLDVNGRVRVGDINYTYGGTNYHVLLAEDSNDAYISNINGNAIISSGGYYYGSNLRLLNSTSTSYSGIQARADGAIAFENATGGTAGSTIAVSEKMRINGSGDVGIGTTAPSEKLEVVGNAVLDNSNAKLKIKAGGTGTVGSIDFTFNTDSTQYGLIDLNYNSRATQGFRIKSLYPLTLDAVTNQKFLISGSEKMLINSSGNVGIGTGGNVDERLHIQGSVDNDDIALKIENTFDNNSSANPPSAAVLFQTASNNGHIRVFGAPADTAANHRMDIGATASTSYLTFSPSNTEKMRIASSGKVGIGTTNPDGLLHVSSGTSGDAVVIIESDTDNSNENDNPHVELRQDGGGIKAKLGIEGNAGNTYSNSLSNATYLGTVFQQSLQFITGNTGNVQTAKMTIQPNTGNVGIGTTNPLAKLQVNGGIQLANDTSSPSLYKAGTFRYRTSGNNSYVDMCMQTGASTYAWVNIVTNSW